MKMRVLAGTAALALISAPGLLLAQDAGVTGPQTSTQAPSDPAGTSPEGAPAGEAAQVPSQEPAPDAGAIDEAPAGALPEGASPPSDDPATYPACSKTVKDHCRNPHGR